MTEREYRELLRERRRERRRIVRRNRRIAFSILMVLVFLLGFLFGRGCGGSKKAEEEETEEEMTEEETEEENDTLDSLLITEFPDWIDEQFITINQYSRPGYLVREINAVVIHYTGNPGTTAQQNHDYYEELATTHEESVSSNFVVGLEGEIIACVPPGEVAYASNDRNGDTVSIETCHPDETGEFTDETYDALVKLTAWLCDTYGLDPDDGGVIRHYDVTGKECPKYFVDNEDAWEQFLEDVADAMES